MYKNINFYLGKSEAINVSSGIDKFCLKLTIIAKDTYSHEDMQNIVNYINNSGININVNFENKPLKIKNNKNKNKICGECEYYSYGIGCQNDKSKARNKNLRTEKSKGCYWGKWN